MNHEPTHRAPNDMTRQEVGEDYLNHLTTWLPTEITTRLTEIYARQGTAFAVYLALPDVDQTAERIEDNFLDVFAGFVPDQDSLVTDTIDSFGWDRDLDLLLEGHPLLRQVVAFDQQAITDLLRERYEIVSLNGGHYLFEAAP